MFKDQVIINKLCNFSISSVVLNGSIEPPDDNKIENE